MRPNNLPKREIAVYNTPIGICHIEYCKEVLYGLKISTDNNQFDFSEHIKYVDTNKAELVDEKCYADVVYNQLIMYLSGSLKSFDIQYDISSLTEFQQRVLSVLISIPYGSTFTYKDVAVKLSNSRATRAVGMACNRNPIQIIIPCHRVVGAKNALVGYAAGVEIKRYLLQLEEK